MTGPSKRLARRVRSDPSLAAFALAASVLPFAWSARTISPSLSGTRVVTARSGTDRGAVTTGEGNVSRRRSAASSAGSRPRAIAEPATSAWYSRHGDGGHSAP